VTTNFGERSGGFAWFFSFLAAFSELRDTEDLILLLDEPGLGLHAAGQADLLRYLDEQLAVGHQVVYTTHLPSMVDAARPHRVRTVEDVEGEGTRVHEGAGATSRDTVLPLSGALADQGVVLPERLLALTELTGQSEAGLEDLFEDAFYCTWWPPPGSRSWTRRSWSARARSSGGSSGPPGRPLTATARPGTSSTSSSGCCRPSAARPCTASPFCSPPWTSCSLGGCRPPTRC
jgi:hypothetical protein